MQSDDIRSKSVQQVADAIKEPLAQWVAQLLACHLVAVPHLRVVQEALEKKVEERVEELSRPPIDEEQWKEMMSLLLHLYAEGQQK